MLTRPLLIGRGPWAQKVYTALPPGVQASISGSITARECLSEARNRGNDCVIIASRTDTHCELLKAAFAQQLPVFCEKPMVMSTMEAEAVEFAWRAAGEPPFLCDFVHLWTSGFEFAWPRFKSVDGWIRSFTQPLATPKFYAHLGGEVRRKDIHPVWDYGCHAIAMALMLGVDCRGLTMGGAYGDQWVIENEHVEIWVNVNLGTDKRFEVQLGDVFTYRDGKWTFPSSSGDREYTNKESPPLQRALKWFLNTNKDAWRSSTPNRDGMWLPVQVTRVLDSICSSASPFK